MWFIGVEVEQEISAPPPKKNPGSAPVKIGKSDLIDTNCIDQSAEINETLISFIDTSVHLFIIK